MIEGKSCTEQIEEQFQNVSKITSEISQQVLIDVFFKFASRSRLDNYINQHLDYYVEESFLKLITHGFIPQSDEQMELLYDREFDMNTVNRIKPGYFYVFGPSILETPSFENGYILIHLESGEKYIYYNGETKKVSNFNNFSILTNITYRLPANIRGSLRLIRFKYVEDYIQVFRDLILILKLEYNNRCDELVDLVEIFVRTLKLKLTQQQELSYIIPRLTIEQEIFGRNYTRMSKTSKGLQSYMRTSKLKYNPIYLKLSNFINRDPEDMNNDDLLEIVPSDTPREEILDDDRAQIMLVCLIYIDSLSTHGYKTKIGMFDNKIILENVITGTFREFLTTLYQQKVIGGMENETFYYIGALYVFYSGYVLDESSWYSLPFNARYKTLGSIRPYVIAYQLSLINEVEDNYINGITLSDIIFVDKNYKRIDGDFDFIMSLFVLDAKGLQESLLGNRRRILNRNPFFDFVANSNMNFLFESDINIIIDYLNNINVSVRTLWYRFRESDVIDTIMIDIDLENKVMLYLENRNMTEYFNLIMAILEVSKRK